jgi:protease-4
MNTAIKLIEKASKDSSIRGVYLLSKDNANGYAGSSELRNALTAFKTSGKFIIGYGDYISQKAYYVASVANKIYCHPKGMFEWQGMSVEYTFFKNLIDKLEIKPQIFYAGKFKSATEPFRTTAMSDANKEQTSVWLNDIYGEMIDAVASSRNKSIDSLKSYANRFALDKPEKAVAAGLLDGLKYDDQVRDEIRQRLKIGKTDKINFISLAKYSKAVSVTGAYSKDKIALVLAEGEIVYGKGSPGQIGSDEYLALLRKLRSDKSVKAIVLRVNSPGGSSLASEIIWRELELIRKEGKKIVVSMGDVAASGGYYIACNADKIMVQPNTITGSIGVFSIVPDFSSFMNNKLGISFDRVKTGEYADMPSVTRALTENEKQFIQGQVDQIYLDFKTRVAEGRKKDINYIDSIAQGRVWTGKRAIQLGLADKIGGLEEAIAEAAKMAGMKEFKVRKYPEPQSILEYFMDKGSSDLTSSTLQKELGMEDYQLFKRIKAMKEEKGEIKSQLPFEFIIK